MIIKNKNEHDAIKYLNETDHELFKLVEQFLLTLDLTDTEKELINKRIEARSKLKEED